MNKYIHCVELSNEYTGEKNKLFKCQITQDVQTIVPTLISDMLPPLRIHFDDNKMFVNYLDDRWYLKLITNEDFEDDPDMISEWSKLIE